MNCFRADSDALGLNTRIVAVDRNRATAAMHAADSSYVVPDCRSLDFVPALLDICRREHVTLVVPTIDTELPVLSQAAQEFAANGTVVAVSGENTIKIAGNKIDTHRWLTSEGFPTVRQVTAEVARSERDAWPYPLIVKPAAGSASMGVRVATDDLSFDFACRIDTPIAQSVAPGSEYTVDVLVSRDGHVLCAIPRRRIEVRAGEVSKAITVRDGRVTALASDIARRLPDAYGVLNIQMFLDEPTGQMNVVEINPRFGGGFPLSHRAGGRFPRWLLEEVLGLPVTASADEWHEDVVMLRYDAEVFVDAQRASISC
jgi:carbamoyl-phosphate synthase large subunit